MTTLRVGSATDAGRVRSNNQDAKLSEGDLWAVADGMGGHQGGEVASALAVETLQAEATERSLESLAEGVRIANRAIFERAGADPNLHGMGTTLCAIRVVDGPLGEEIAWVNVGDSRIYLFRDDELIQLTTDHSLVEDLVRDGQLSPEEAKVHPRRNIITRALGIDIDVEVDGNTVIPVRGDRFLLCSDGLFNEVEENRMAGVLRRLEDPDEAAAELVRLANEHGGRDNITVVIAEVTDDDGAAFRASQALADEPSGLESDAVTTPAAGGDAEAADGADAAAGDAGPALAGRRSSLPEAPEDFGSGSDDLYGDLDHATPRHLTWRVVAFLVALVVLFGVAAAAVGWYARNTYYVGFADERVAVYKGRPGGVLWFDPTVVQRTQIRRSDLPGDLRSTLDKGKDEASAAAARRYIVSIEAETTTTTTSTTTTTTTSTTTTAPATPTTTAPGAPGATPVPTTAPATPGSTPP